jgi:hypothetical protein
MSESTAAACWICLDDGPDDAGKPTVRNCSCRGSDAGFAHISCIVDYATRRCLEDSSNSDSKIQDYQDPWIQCPTCNQEYHGQVKDELDDKYVEFTENHFPEFDWRRLLAYLNRPIDSDECVSKITSICDKLENGEFDQLSIHPVEIKNLLSMAYFVIGNDQIKHGLDNHDEYSAKRGIGYLKRAKVIEEELGDTPGALETEAQISCCISDCIDEFGHGFGETYTAEEELEKLRVAYESSIDRYGEVSDNSIASGKAYASALLTACHRIKAWRMLIKLIAFSQRIHGPEHERTLYLKGLLDLIHLVAIKNQDGVFRALRYDGDQCVVQGPIQQPRIYSGEKVFRVSNSNVILSEGIPVICHGLKNAAYLNEKIGECRGYDDDAIEERYGVLFADESIPPKSVKPENLRILFELPESAER